MDFGRYIWIGTKANVVLIIFHLGRVPVKKRKTIIKTRRKKFFFVLSDKVGMRWEGGGRGLLGKNNILFLRPTISGWKRDGWRRGGVRFCVDSHSVCESVRLLWKMNRKFSHSTYFSPLFLSPNHPPFSAVFKANLSPHSFAPQLTHTHTHIHI